MVVGMSRYRLCPTPAQQIGLLAHCAHARFVWNLAVEQHSHWRPGRASAPTYREQARQLTEARAEHAWLAAGSVTVQQQALRDFHQAMANFFRGTHRRPTWRKAGQHEGFRQVAVRPDHIQRLNRKAGRVWVPKVGWVHFRWTRAIPTDVKSYRITCDRVGRWHVAFAVVPAPVPAPGTAEIVGVDRGVTVSAALSTGELLRCPDLSDRERHRLRKLERRLARAKRGSNRRSLLKIAIAKLKAKAADRRNDWLEKTSTQLARRFDLVRVEDLNVSGMTRSARGTIDQAGRGVRAKASLNRGILAAGWGRLVARLEDKAPGRVERINPAFTSQTCSTCGHCAPDNRKSQAVFRCIACGHQANADVNAACNIAAGRAVTARGGDRVAGPANREPQLAPPSAAWWVGVGWNPGRSGPGGRQGTRTFGLSRP
jgi:putative transposase